MNITALISAVLLTSLIVHATGASENTSVPIGPNGYLKYRIDVQEEGEVTFLITGNPETATTLAWEFSTHNEEAGTGVLLAGYVKMSGLEIVARSDDVGIVEATNPSCQVVATLAFLGVQPCELGILITASFYPGIWTVVIPYALDGSWKGTANVAVPDGILASVVARGSAILLSEKDFDGTAAGFAGPTFVSAKSAFGQSIDLLVSQSLFGFFWVGSNTDNVYTQIERPDGSILSARGRSVELLGHDPPGRYRFNVLGETDVGGPLLGPAVLYLLAADVS